MPASAAPVPAPASAGAQAPAQPGGGASGGCAGDMRRQLRSASGNAIVAAMLAACGAAATPPSRAAPPFEDSIAQRVLACTGCHGPAGRAAADGYYPRIAGKPVGYLYNQLRNFRDGRRPYAPMTTLLGALGGPAGDLYLLEIARHFASLELPYAAPAPVPGGVGGADDAALARGEALVRRGDAALGLPACAQCHGAALMGVAPSIPGLLGLPRDYLNAQLGAWRAGHRQAQPPDCMAQVARALAPTDIAALSGWLSSQPVPAGARPVGARSAVGPAAVPAPLPSPLPLPCGGVPVFGIAGGTAR